MHGAAPPAIPRGDAFEDLTFVPSVKGTAGARRTGRACVLQRGRARDLGATVVELLAELDGEGVAASDPPHESL